MISSTQRQPSSSARRRLRGEVARVMQIRGLPRLEAERATFDIVVVEVPQPHLFQLAVRPPRLLRRNPPPRSNSPKAIFSTLPAWRAGALRRCRFRRPLRQVPSRAAASPIRIGRKGPKTPRALAHQSETDAGCALFLLLRGLRHRNIVCPPRT